VTTTSTSTHRQPRFNAVLDAPEPALLLRGGGHGRHRSAAGARLPAAGATTIRHRPRPTTSLSFATVPRAWPTPWCPPGYSASVLYALGDPLDAATPAYRNDGTDTDFDRRAGDHHDGMEYFGLSTDGTRRDANSSERGLLVMNHEAPTALPPCQRRHRARARPPRRQGDPATARR
jgi:secreted PhoX family phosphatase